MVRIINRYVVSLPQLVHSLLPEHFRVNPYVASPSLLSLIDVQPQPPNPEHKRMKREKKTIAYMVDIYCRSHHGTHGELCPECVQFKEYAFLRLDKCPFQDKKSTCGKCLIHCYRPDMKEKVKQVMRYSGPRMLLYHPSLAFHHAWDSHRKPPKLAKKQTG